MSPKAFLEKCQAQLRGGEELSQEALDELVALATRSRNPVGDAACLLYNHYWYVGNEDEAWKWKDLAEDLGSPLLEAQEYEEKEQEVGEDNWTKPE